MQAPAYTTVTARQTFDRPAPNTSYIVPAAQPPPAASTTSPAKPTREWPPSVRQYVQRAFAASNAVAGVSREQMEARLKKIITEAAEGNQLLAIDWDHLPLPQEMLQGERLQDSVVHHVVTSASNGLSNLNMHDASNPLSSFVASKKRKSSDLPISEKSSGAVPPWRKEHTSAFEKRLSVAEKKPRLHGPELPISPSSASLESRKRRFERELRATPPWSAGASSELDDQAGRAGPRGPVVGRSQKLEKRYFRLTSAPNPEDVRPLPILEKTLDLLKQKWRKDSNYSYICDQFKSLRQDLTVQHIQTDFTVNVYEIHARIALERGDLGEYNQCQTQLRALYAQHLGGHPTEFKAYRILYFLHTCNRTDMNDVLADLTPTEKKAPAIKHALDARSALALGNYHRFFKLYLETPNMGAYLMDMFVTRERLVALANICKAYKPDLRLRFITEELGFESDEEAARFVCDHGGQAFLEDRDGDVRLLAGRSAAHFDAARKAASAKVDIKGQI